MTAKQVHKDFKNLYGNYKQELKNDYCKVQFDFMCYIDGLNKDGILTDNQTSRIQLPK